MCIRDSVTAKPMCYSRCTCVMQGLETIPHLKDDIADRDKRIAQLEKEIEDKSALLTASRKAVREYKDRIRVRLSAWV